MTNWKGIDKKTINEWMNKWMNEWMNKWMNEWINDWLTDYLLWDLNEEYSIDNIEHI